LKPQVGGAAILGAALLMSACGLTPSAAPSQTPRGDTQACRMASRRSGPGLGTAVSVHLIGVAVDLSFVVLRVVDPAGRRAPAPTPKLIA
jgi:hypothetical protein